MSVKEKGKVVFKSDIAEGTSKSGNAWANQTIVVEVAAGYNAVKRVALRAGSRILEKCQQIQVGAIVEVEYNVTAREWSGKWYNDVDLWDITPIGANAPAPAPASAAQSLEPQSDDLPWD